jgi:hypothetical protein
VPEVIDAHVHLSGQRDDGLRAYAEGNSLSYSLEELLRLMGELGVATGLLLSSIDLKGVPFPNDDVMQLCAESRGKLLPALTVAPNEQTVTDAVGLAKKDHSVRAFKIMLGYGRTRADDPVFEPLYDHAESSGTPVMFHTGDTAESKGSLMDAHPLNLDAVANRHAAMRVVACHFGNPWIEDVAELVYKHPNVYADVSGMAAGGGRYAELYADSLAERLSRAIYYAGSADKVIFGSDYPVTHPAKAIALVEKLEIDSKDRKKILAGNAKKVYRL